MIKILKANQGYNNHLLNYKAKDGVLAVALMGITLLLYAIIALFEIYSVINKNNFLIAGCIFNIFLIGITVLFVRKNNEKIDTLGLFNGNWITSCIIGIIYAGFLFYNNCLSRLYIGSSLLPVNDIIMLTIYYLLVSLCEEIVFRGYIGTRIFGLVKSKWLAVIVTGLMFIIMHFPYRMIAYGMTLSDLTINNLNWIIDLFLTHIIFSFIYIKTNSLYGSIIPHWISNLAYNIVSM